MIGGEWEEYFFYHHHHNQWISRLKAAELARDKKQKQQCITVLFLDDSTSCFRIDKKGKGKDILDQVFDFLDLRERDYFGLQFPHKPGEVVVSSLVWMMNWIERNGSSSDGSILTKASRSNGITPSVKTIPCHF